MFKILDAQQELYSVFAKNASGVPKSWLAPKVQKVFDHEPWGASLIKPVSITICYAGENFERETILFDLRIYSDATKDSKNAQNTVAEIIDLIDYGAPDGTSHIPAEYLSRNWEIQYELTLQAWVAICRIERGREDY